MDHLFVEIITKLEEAFHQMERKVPPPVLVERGGFEFFRYPSESADAAVIQKLARIVTGLRGCLVLLQSGLFQEVGMLFRALDEFGEDVLFLCEAVRKNEITELHRRYLADFYQEEFGDPGRPYASALTRSTVPRRKIQAANARIEGQPVNPNDAQQLSSVIAKAYSGFVHGASCHIMELYGGDPPRYHLASMHGTPRQVTYYKAAVDYFYRGLLTFMYAAGAFENRELLADLQGFRDKAEKGFGMTSWPDPTGAFDRLKKGSR